MIANEVLAIAPDAGVVSFVKCPRKGNLVAHSLARAATGIPSAISMSANIASMSIIFCCDSSFFESFSVLEDDESGRDLYIPEWLTSLIEEDFCASAPS